MRRMTSARLARWISGCVNCGRSVEIFLAHTAGCTRRPARGPLRPLRWLALLWETGFDRQPFGARARIVAADARQPGINDVTDAGNGQRRFRDVRGDDDLAARAAGRRRVAGPPALNKPNSGMISASRPKRPSSRSLVSRMSRSPGMKINMSPLPGSHSARFRRAHGGIYISDVAALFRIRVERRVDALPPDIAARKLR